MEFDLIEEPLQVQYLPQSHALSDINLHLFQEFFWYQIDPNIPTININKDSPLNDKRLSSKDTPPSYYFQQVFTLDSSVIVCKVVERMLLLSKRNIYHRNRAKQFKINASFEPYATSNSDQLNSEFDVLLQFPTKLVRDVICVEFEKGDPILFIPSSVGIVYLLKLKEMHLLLHRNDLNIPTLELDIGYTFMNQLVKSNQINTLTEKEGLLLAASCSNATIYFLHIPQLFDESHRRISVSYDVRLTNGLFNSLIGNILPKHNEKDSLVTLQYISHKILVGVTRNNVIKVINLNRRGVILEYRLDDSENQNEKNEDLSEVCLRVISSNPLIRNNKLNFLLGYCRINSPLHRYVKLFNLSFKISHKGRDIYKLSEVPSTEDLGVNCELSLIANYETTNLITSLDMNQFGIAVSSYDETDCNSEVHHLRFLQGKLDLSSGLFSEATEVLSFDAKRSNLLNGEISPEVMCIFSK